MYNTETQNPHITENTPRMLKKKGPDSVQETIAFNVDNHVQT
jgi:hypothetical protein